MQVPSGRGVLDALLAGGGAVAEREAEGVVVDQAEGEGGLGAGQARRVQRGQECLGQGEGVRAKPKLRQLRAKGVAGLEQPGDAGVVLQDSPQPLREGHDLPGPAVGGIGQAGGSERSRRRLLLPNARERSGNAQCLCSSTTKGGAMSIQLGDTAPDFEAETTQGRIRFHDWIGDSWALLFSHPKDFTPVCTTELGYMAKIKPEFERRNVKIVGLSVDAASDHTAWAKDIEATQGQAPNYPIIGDADFHVSKRYGMLPATTSGDSTSRTPADKPDRAQRVRDRPRQEGQARPGLSDDDWAQLR